MQISYENYLAHYGVKGMKWGVRRGSKKRIKTSRPKVTKETVSKMTDDDLRKKTQRLRLEAEYKETIQRHDRLFASKKQQFISETSNTYTKGLGQMAAREMLKGTAGAFSAVAASKLIKAARSK